MKNFTLIFVLFTTLFLYTGCTALVEGTIRDTLVGNWEAISVMDVESGDVKIKEDGDEILFLFENKLCDAFTLESGGDFNTYYADGGFTLEENGTWEYEFLDLTLSFDDGKTLVRSVEIDGDLLILPDTIGGRAKVVTFLKFE